MKKLESTIYFPSTIVWEILSRLPTKACLKFKLVCKDWYSIITSLEFVDFRSFRCPYFTILLYGQFYPGTKKDNFILLDLDKSLKVDEIGNLKVSSETTIRFKPKPLHKLHLINECNGLICFKSKQYWGPFITCNLLTGEQVKVKQTRKPSYSAEIYGLGCCPVSSQFKLVRILKRYTVKLKSEAEVCTIGTNELWRAIGDAPNCHFSYGTAFLHGSLHRFSNNGNCIWSFQFGNEKFVHIPLPNVRRFNGRDYGHVNVFQSCLALSCLSEDRSHSEVWVMKEYGMEDSWAKLFVIDTIFCHMPLFQMNDKEMLVIHSGDFGLRISDIESGKCKRSPVLGVFTSKAMEFNVKFSNPIIAFEALPTN